MSDHAIQHVSDTALWVAAYRAIESERPDALFRDPLAARLVGERGRRIAAHMKSGGVVQWAVVIRTCIIDAVITEAIQNGVDTVLNLGSGLDTRPYRMELPPSLRWVEVDYPHLQEFKEKTLQGEVPRCHLERVSLDLADLAARQALLSRVNAQATRTLVLTEGVTPYLTPEQVASLADDLRAQSTFRLWVLDYLATSRLRHGFGTRRLRDRLKHAPMQFMVDDWQAFFAGVHWRVKEMHYYVDESEKRKRPFSIPWWMWLRIIFMSRKRREAMRRMSGYAVLEPENS